MHALQSSAKEGHAVGVVEAVRALYCKVNPRVSKVNDIAPVGAEMLSNIPEYNAKDCRTFLIPQRTV